MTSGLANKSGTKKEKDKEVLQATHYDKCRVQIPKYPQCSGRTDVFWKESHALQMCHFQI